MTDRGPIEEGPDSGPPRPAARRTSSRRRWAVLIQAAGSVGLLGLVAWSVDGEAIGSALAQVDIGILVAMLALVQAQLILSAWRWRLTAGALDVPIGWRLAIGDYALASGLNQVLPGGMAGDAVRAWRHGRRVGGPSTPSTAAAGAGAAARAEPAGWGPILRTVVLERTAGQVAFLAVTLLCLPVWPLLLPSLPTRLVLAVSGGVLLTLAAAAFGVWLSARIGPRAWRDGVASLGPDLRRAFLAPGLWPLQLTLSLVTALGFLALLGLASVAVGAPLPPAGWVSVVPLTLLTMLVPISVGGWGVREGAAAVLWPLAGLAAADGVAASVVYGAVTLVGTLPLIALAVLAPPRPQR